MSKKGRYHCRHCGADFNLTAQDQDAVDQGYGTHPDSCYDCDDMIENSQVDYPEFSDADPGL